MHGYKWPIISPRIIVLDTCPGLTASSPQCKQPGMTGILSDLGIALDGHQAGVRDAWLYSCTVLESNPPPIDGVFSGSWVTMHGATEYPSDLSHCASAAWIEPA